MADKGIPGIPTDRDSQQVHVRPSIFNTIRLDAGRMKTVSPSHSLPHEGVIRIAPELNTVEGASMPSAWCAASVIVLILGIALFAFFPALLPVILIQNPLSRGLTMGAVKG